MTSADAETLFGHMLDGVMSDAEIAETLVTIADREETADEIAGAARAMRARMIPVTAPTNAIDVCGTGGDGSHSLNVSTAVAIVVAACGVPVAKHGNRAASSKAGAADTLEALGLDLDHASQTAEATLAELGICFLFAQKHHPALARIAPIRKSLGRRTIFNLLGPLANPARVTKQLIGVAQPGFVARYADAMALLGYERAMVVSGWDVENPDGDTIDELSVAGGHSTKMIGITPVDGSLAPNRAVYNYYPISALKGGDASFNAAALKRMLLGEKGAYREAVQLNAAGALLVSGEVDSWQAGFEEAAEAIDKGLAKALLDCWIAYK